MVDIGSGPAVLGAFEVRMLQNIVLPVHHRLFASYKQNSVVIVQRPNLVGQQQLTATLSSGKLKKMYRSNAIHLRRKCKFLVRVVARVYF